MLSTFTMAPTGATTVGPLQWIPGRKGHSFLEADARENRRESMNDAVERILIVVHHDHLPSGIEPSTRIVGPRLANNLIDRRAHQHDAAERRASRLSAMTPDERLDRYARLAVEMAVNLQPGQFLRISAEPEHLPLVRAIARVAYERGARYVDVHYRTSTSAARGSSTRPRTRSTGRRRGARAARPHRRERGATISITGDAEPELLADLDGSARQARMRELAEKLLDATTSA